VSLSRQFLLYIGCAGCAAAVNFLSGFLLIQRAGFDSGMRYPMAIAIGYSLGMAVNFSMNRHFTFSGNRRTQFEQARTFVVVALSGLALSTAIAAGLRPALLLVLPAKSSSASFFNAEAAAQVATIGIVAIYSFTAHRYFTFHRGIRHGFAKFL
jgi:putative flippase GtrA